MIVLDTNVISELFRPRPDPAVMTWLAACPADDLFTSAVTRGELLYGAHILPAGQRKDALLAGLLRIFGERFPNRVLPYDEAAADAHAGIAAQRSLQGRPGSHADLMIAGIAQSQGAALATRNVRDFADCGIALIDPWH
ncbi:type II toxin-antitoxin system VapC family toxin [Dokdonella sp. MW10]|uniref:type II toxin-antitoxin system VapC family toxin n=1 Tax=Dokdonella sp. MW10 TaxID=2992926 RepID=UPI003F7E4F58